MVSLGSCDSPDGSRDSPNPPRPDDDHWKQSLLRDGFTLIRGIYRAEEMQAVADALTQCFGQAVGRPRAVDSSGSHPVGKASIRSRCGVVYAARNLLDVYPASRTLWDRPRLRQALQTVLGEESGLVRGLYFDKPPDQSWSLPWHQDRTIAVADNQLPSGYFQNPTKKEGVPHVEAPDDLLDQMLTLRIHLDQVTPDNGPLVVLPGSHRVAERDDGPASATPVLAEPGDVLLMRPLLSHCSGKSSLDCQMHRRIVHLEFSARRALPDGFTWHHFVPLNP